MKYFDFKKDVLPHLLVVFTFITLTFIYFKPAVFEHKGMKQHDILEYQGSAEEIIQHREKYSEEPLWTNSMFGGMPAYLISTIHKGELIQKVANTIFGIFPHPSGVILINLISFYILLLAFGVRPLYAAVGAFAFAFASYNLVSLVAGHNNRVKALGYAPMVLAGVILVFRNRLFTGFIIAAIGVALNVGSNHYQITYYLCFILFLVGIVELIYAVKEKSQTSFLKKVGVLVLAAIIGLGANFGSFLTTFEYSKFTMRGGAELTPKETSLTNSNGGLDKEYAFRWSYGIFETFSLIIPNIQGGASIQALDKESHYYKSLVGNGVAYGQAEEYIQNVPTYWGDQESVAGPNYFGSIICFLFVLGLLVLDDKIRIWLIAATVIAIVLSWGKNFSTLNYFVFDFLPGYNKFRSVSWTLTIAQICVPIGAILALNKIIEEKYSKALFKKLLIAAGITGGLCLLFGLFGGMASFKGAVDEQLASQPAWLLDALKADRESLLKSDAWRSFFLILIASGLLWAAWKEKLSKTATVVIIGFLILFDHWVVDKRYLNDNNFERRVSEQHFQPTQADQAILQDSSNYRVLNLTGSPWQEARTSYYHKSIGGYSGAKMQRYQDLIEYSLSDEISRFIKNLQNRSIEFSGLNALNMLNTKYFILGEGAQEALRNDKALGSAWFISEINKVNTPDEEIEALDSIDPGTTAILDESKFDQKKTSFIVNDSAFIQLKNYKANHLIYQSENANEGFAVFSEVYYPKGWKAYIDGTETPIKRVNYILRALEIPAGKHKIEFKFEPKSYSIGNLVSMISSIFLMVCSLGGVVYWGVKKKDDLNR
ncbi:MAG TPA: YfhO family protein [Cytophagales bacterium]|nr:YfhO family protein [Cytophagales bacterium]